MPKISVIIPMYNVEKYLSATLSSLQTQTFDDFEAICVDNGSTDQSLSVLREITAKDSRIKIIEQENRGVSAARNAALDRASGEYIAFLDSDDLMHPQMLETMLHALETSDSDIVYCDYVRFNDGEDVSFEKVTSPAIREIPEHFKTFLSKKEKPLVPALWNKLYRTELFKNIRLPEDVSIAEDFVAICSVLFAAKKVSYVPASLIYYRQRSGSLIRSALDETYIQNAFKATRLILERFENETLLPVVRKKLNYRLMRMLCKDCIVTPHRRSKKDKSYLKVWDKYQPLLLDLKNNGLYQPQYLDLRNRLFSVLFLKRKFATLHFLLSWI